MKYNNIANRYTIENSIFYELCNRANSVCTINYDKITFRDLLFFSCIAFKNIYIQDALKKDYELTMRAKKYLKG